MGPLYLAEWLVLAALAAVIARRGAAARDVLVGLGLVCAALGDGCLAVLGGRPRGVFLCGVAAFACAHLCWTAAALREARPDGRIALALAIPLSVFCALRLFPSPGIDAFTAAALGVYALVSVAALAAAAGTRRAFFGAGLACLFVSDVLIACRMARLPHWGAFIGPFYLAALACLVASVLLRDEPRVRPGAGDPVPFVLLGGFLAFGCFGAAIVLSPEPYNPCMKMLSHLGRTRIGACAYPACHYLFSIGLVIGALTTAAFVPHFADEAETPARRHVVPWCGALHVAGLALVAVAPENVSPLLHNAGCHLAFFGAAGILFALATNRFARRAAVLLSVTPLVFLAFFILHACGAIPFAPWIPTCQKALILSLPAWLLVYAVKRRARRRAISPVDSLPPRRVQCPP